MALTAYAIGGLGADKRVLSRININIPIIHLDWIPPKKGESLISYAKRFVEYIDTSQSFILIGVSFGGLLVQELSRYVNPDRVILISSFTQKEQLPRVFRLMLSTELFTITPVARMKPPIWLAKWLFGITDPESSKLLQAVLRDTDPKFIQWAFQKIREWRSHTEDKVISIHGTSDRLIRPPKENYIPINRGGHFMVVDRADEVSNRINHILGKS